MSANWQEIDDRLTEQKDHYESFISTLHEIINQKSKRIQELETQLQHKEIRESVHHNVSENEILKLMLEKQMRINYRSSSVCVSRHDQETQTETDEFLASKEKFKKMMFVIDQVSESVALMLENVSLSLPIDRVKNPLEFIRNGLCLLKNQVKILETEYSDLQKKIKVDRKEFEFYDTISKKIKPKSFIHGNGNDPLFELSKRLELVALLKNMLASKDSNGT